MPTSAMRSYRKGPPRSGVCMGMHGALLLVLACALSAEDGGGHRFRVADGPRLYQYHLQQEVRWQSVGDQITYRTEQVWQFSLKPESQTEDGAAVITVRMLGLRARHSGPNLELTVSSYDEAPDNDDPRLGNLLAQIDVPLRLTVDPTTGAVAAVDGWQGIVDAVNQRNPGPPGGEPPFAAQARTVFGAEAQARRWSEVLQVPATGSQEVPLHAPASGTVRKTWDGDSFTLELAQAQSVELHSYPKPTQLELTALTGTGTVTIEDGILERTAVDMTFTVTGEALGQNLSQEHHLTWEVARIGLARRTPEAPDATPETNAPGDATP